MTLIVPGLLAGLAGGLAVASAAGIAAHRRTRAAIRQARCEADVAHLDKDRCRQHIVDLEARLRAQESLTRAAEAAARAAEAAARHSKRLAEVGTLTGGLAHEIKNPLSTVGLNLQLLQEDLDPNNPSYDRLRNRLSTVQRETARLRDILDDFLRYAGKLELDRRPVDLNALLEELADFFAPQAQAQRVQLRLRPHAIPVIADVDERVVKQAVLNLMINAVQAMTGGGELILSVTPVSESPAGHEDGSRGIPTHAVVDVIDTGPGIGPDVVDQVFHAYFSTKKGGTGLGLAMARRIAEEHGGSLSVRSELGKGTDFSLRLPLKAHSAHVTPEITGHESDLQSSTA